MDDLTTLEVVGCEAGFWACALESWGGDVAAYALLGSFVVGCLGVVWMIWARGIVDDHRRQTPRSTPRPRIVAGPELHDGSWVRLVEAAPGHFRAEIYVDRAWHPLYRNPSRFFEAAMRTRQQLGSR
jgi:hypothetical protein